MNERNIFNTARHIAAADKRDAYLQEACGGDADLRGRVNELLEAHDQAGSFLEPAAGAAYSPTISDAPITESPGTVIGPYKLLEQIGEGGFGVVFMAEQIAPVKRKVALKVIKPGMDTREVIARFEAERQALALMDHPNIAKVFDAGTTGVVEGQESRGKSEKSLDSQPLTLGPAASRPYFVMELVRGIPITDYCDQHEFTPRERLELFVTVCHAVQHAHHKGIIHRDIKPTNVLVTQHDDRPVVKVIDFGIAKAMSGQLTDRTLFTGFTQMVGTPLYMSPEQAALSAIDVDTRSDIFSLGVLLYEVLTGTTPFDKTRLQQAGFDEVRRIIREEEPPRPSARISTLRGAGTTASAALRNMRGKRPAVEVAGELDWIVMKALEKDRNRRYESASALARDIERYLRDEPVLACPPSNWYRFRKFARRNKSALATASVVALAVLVALAALGTSTVLTTDALEDSKQARSDLEQTLERERQDGYFHRIALAQRELSADNLGRALELLDECPDDLRNWEWYYLRRLCRVEPFVLRDNCEFTAVAFSPNGGQLATSSSDGAVKIWSSGTGQLIQILDTNADSAVSVAWHPQGRHVAAAGEGQAKVWDLTTSQEVFSAPCDSGRSFGAAHTVAFSPDGRCLAAGHNGAIKTWDWRTRQVLFTLNGHEPHEINVAFSRDGRRLATGSWGGSVRLWDTQAGGAPLHSFADSRDTRHPACALAFDRDGRRLASASFDRRVDVWDTTTGRLLRTLPHRDVLVVGVAFSPDGRRLASVGEKKTVHIWDPENDREVLGLRGHGSMVGCVAFSPDGHRIASASLDGTVRIWDATPLADGEGQEVLTFDRHEHEIWSLAVSPDGQIASGGFSTPVKIWNAETGQVRVDCAGHKDIVFCVAWDPDGRRVASAGSDNWSFTVKVSDAGTGREVFSLPPGPEYYAVAFSPDGRFLVTGQADRGLRVWDAHTGAALGTLGVHARDIRGIVFSPDGRHVASASGDGVVNLWDATRLTEEQQPRLTLTARVPGPCLNLAFSPDSARLATSGREHTVIIRDVQTGEVLQTLRGHTGDVYTMAFSPHDDGRWIATAGEDTTIKIWDSHGGGLPIRSLRGHIGLVSSLSFTPDGRLVSGSRDHTAKVWDVTDVTQSHQQTRHQERIGDITTRNNSHVAH